MRTLVTGGVRSGKSAHAESLLAGMPVTYIAPGPTADDADWAARVAAHRARRPSEWSTVETGDLVSALSVEGPVLIDCLGTWLNRWLDERQLWETDTETAVASVATELDRIVVAIRQDPARDLVVVTNEVGLGVVPEHRSGRLFRDLLGLINQRVAAACDEVHLVIAGRVLTL
ncbi:cobalamin biosynthesis protein CobU [Nocardioides baekrokdamisoli]|uniref:Adenosylcobinamide kinase n=1 Tax=Nocardioides baekrokdamisoli TaxID=1804624 RepID=A0A3G9ICV3_9ACTN|nr:bifunctional adenosylcobinamide kinase/adenosylcobinamide-phosphate guanylyltransferase [Nocardioides baekrokdamisoli]BBH16202.1 cobalamin biosynthesis protein CobU [Nocardioides baekrokdamisoli]